MDEIVIVHVQAGIVPVPTRSDDHLVAIGHAPVAATGSLQVPNHGGAHLCKEPVHTRNKLIVKETRSCNQHEEKKNHAPCRISRMSEEISPLQMPPVSRKPRWGT